VEKPKNSIPVPKKLKKKQRYVSLNERSARQGVSKTTLLRAKKERMRKHMKKTLHDHRSELKEQRKPSPVLKSVPSDNKFNKKEKAEEELIDQIIDKQKLSLPKVPSKPIFAISWCPYSNVKIPSHKPDKRAVVLAKDETLSDKLHKRCCKFRRHINDKNTAISILKKPMPISSHSRSIKKPKTRNSRVVGVGRPGRRRRGRLPSKNMPMISVTHSAITVIDAKNKKRIHKRTYDISSVVIPAFMNKNCTIDVSEWQNKNNIIIPSIRKLKKEEFQCLNYQCNIADMSSDEDTDDESYYTRHEKCENEEKLERLSPSEILTKGRKNESVLLLRITEEGDAVVA